MNLFVCLQGRNLQSSIEEAFANKKDCFEFNILGQDYKLNFADPTAEMEQKNIKHGTIKKVRRRLAEFKSAADIRKIKRCVPMLLQSNPY